MADARLGKHMSSKGRLCVMKLAGVDLDVPEALIVQSVAAMRAKYPAGKVRRTRGSALRRWLYDARSAIRASRSAMAAIVRGQMAEPRRSVDANAPIDTAVLMNDPPGWRCRLICRR